MHDLFSGARPGAQHGSGFGFGSPSGVPGSRQPIFNVPPITLWVVLAIVAVFALVHLVPGFDRQVITFSVVPARFALTLTNPTLPTALIDAVSLVSHALIHFETLHMLLNAGFLLAFGSFCERVFGRQPYVALLLGSAAGGALTQIATNWGVLLVMFGASGAVSGCMGAMVRILLQPGITNPQRRRFALTFVAIMFVMNIIIGQIGPSLLGLSSSIAWEAHLGGFVTGFLIAACIPARRFP